MTHTVKATRRKKNPYLAVSDDGLNQAFGATKEEAAQNLIEAIERRKANNT
jgi:hypothetical protein